MIDLSAVLSSVHQRCVHIHLAPALACVKMLLVFLMQVLAVFEEIHVNKLLHILVFGESLLNGKCSMHVHVYTVLR